MFNKLLYLLLCLAFIQAQVTLLSTKSTAEPQKQLKKDADISETLVSQLNISPSYSFKTFVKKTPIYQNEAKPEPRIITEEVAGIILSFKNGNSYDGLFSQVEQKSKDGSVVLTFVAEASSQKAVLDALKGIYSEADSHLKLFVKQIQKLSKSCPTCIVFNWECSSNYSGQKFTQGSRYVFGLLDLIIKKGYLAMFSDFSLKALINQWDKQVLGPNPFVKVGQTNTAIKMKFEKDTLTRSPSSQLQAVARLAASDQVTIHVLGGTIKYSVDSRRQETDKYELQVLSIADNFEAPSSNLELSIGRYTGIACHVLLSYKQGGKIITSMGHWIQLMKLDTTQQKLFETAKSLYGEKEYKKLKLDYGNLKTFQQKASFISSNSRAFIQNQSPGANSFQLNN